LADVLIDWWVDRSLTDWVYDLEAWTFIFGPDNTLRHSLHSNPQPVADDVTLEVLYRIKRALWTRCQSSTVAASHLTIILSSCQLCFVYVECNC